MGQLLYTVEEVFKNYLSLNGKNKFNIPEYQRGYKWSENQVKQLLTDIKEFDSNGEEDLFYCLQNITLVANVDNNEPVFNIVDGQQRLTTLCLLLSYLGEQQIALNKIKYSVREQSNLFLHSIVANKEVISNILECKDFSQFLQNSESEEALNFQDIYHMFQAVKNINNWFEKYNVDKITFLEKLLHQVKIIVNNIPNTKEQELFMNLNTGKVSLDGADLVRAILITRVAKQEMEMFDITSIKDIVRLNERRIRIGWELDEINSWWNKNDVKTYFARFIRINTAPEETVEFNPQLNAINLLYTLWVEQSGGKSLRLKQFEQGFSEEKTNALVLYNEILNLHRILKDWFEDRIIYHLLGYISSFNRNYSFKTIIQAWRDRSCREDFNDFLKSQAKIIAFGYEPKQNDQIKSGIDFWLEKIEDVQSPNKTNWYETAELEKLLILLDVIDLSANNKKGNPLPFLKPEFFRRNNEDVEHIYPNTPKNVKEIEEVNSVNEIKKYMQGLGILEHKIFETDEEWTSLSELDRNNKIVQLSDLVNERTPINSIGNLVLLHLTINRAFGNNYYSNKRISVVKNAEEGLYVRQHTLKIFVKNIISDSSKAEENNLNNWTIKDIENNTAYISNKFRSFFDINKMSNEI